VGCATGLFPKLLTDEGYDATGIEINEESAAWGRQHYGARISVRTLEDLEIPSTPYDLITFTDVLEHTLHPLKALEHAKRLLTNKGYVLVTFPDITSLESLYYNLLRKVLHREWLWVTCHIPLHIWEFTPKTASSLFKKAGFEVVGFRRSYHRIDLDGKLQVLSFFPRLLSIAPRLFGTQMEFMLRRQH
jgi:SAM-dependent methyltransferase